MYQNKITRSFRAKGAILISLCAVLLSSCKDEQAQSEKVLTLETNEQRVSYVIGYSIANQIQSGGLDVHSPALMKAFEDVASGSELALTQAQMRSAGSIFQNFIREKKLADIRTENVNKGKQFLTENANSEDVVSLPSGIQYTVINTGDGGSPSSSDRVEVHYHGTLLNGTVFDSSIEQGEPVEFIVAEVIPGWVEVLQLMKPGDKWKVWIPHSLSYPNGTQEIPPGSVLAFEIELISVTKS